MVEPMALSSSAAQISYNAGFIILSYLVSLVGCITTLELLHRRTSRRGLYNWYLLFASSVCMGGVGIWSMHFIGNRAIVLNDGEAGMQIMYGVSSTAASFFLPIVVLLAAFYLLGVVDRGNWYWIVVSGLLTGTAVCGMHYVGQLGISNYNVSYHMQNVVGAAIIAVVASFVALSVFFKLRDTWTDCWWKRSLTAALLACAVSGMHWTAAVGTIYHVKGPQGKPSTRSREQTVIVCTVLSVAACILLLSFTVLDGYKKKKFRNQAKQLVLACAYFDEHGRVMVTPDGSLPREKITDHYIEKTFGADELNRTHPSFVWAFKASRSWSALKDLIPGMKESLESDPRSGSYYPGQAVSSDCISSTSTEDFSGVFKKLFCVAGLNLANNLHEPLETLGPLFEEPLETGTLNSKNDFSYRALLRWKTRVKRSDVETSSTMPALIGRGQYFFLTRQVSKVDVVKYGARGYRFAALKQITEALASNMQIPQAVMLKRLERLRIYSSKEHLMPPGRHLACFVLRPSVQKSFDVLVPTKIQSQLPHISLSFAESAQAFETLQKFDEWTVGSILTALVLQLGASQIDSWDLYRAFSQLVDLVGEPAAMMEAKFSAKKIPVPCRHASDVSATSTCIVFSVRIIMAVGSRSAKPELTYVPLSFFSAQQQLEASPWSQDTFTKQAHLDFAYHGRRNTLVGFKGESRKASVVELSAPSTPTSVLGQSLVGLRRSISRRSGEVQEDQTDVPSDHVNNGAIELVTRSHTNTLSLGSRMESGIEDSGNFVSELFALFRL